MSEPLSVTRVTKNMALFASKETGEKVGERPMYAEERTPLFHQQGQA